MNESVKGQHAPSHNGPVICKPCNYLQFEYNKQTTWQNQRKHQQMKVLFCVVAIFIEVATRQKSPILLLSSSNNGGR